MFPDRNVGSSLARRRDKHLNNVHSIVTDRDRYTSKTEFHRRNNKIVVLCFFLCLNKCRQRHGVSHSNPVGVTLTVLFETGDLQIIPNGFSVRND